MADVFKTIKITQTPGGPLEQQLVGAVNASVGAPDAGKVVLLNASGQIDPSMGGGGGSTVSVNGVTVTDPNFNATTPAAPGGSSNVIWQFDGSGNVSAYYTTSGTAVHFDQILSGINNTAQTLTVGSTSTLTFSGSGVVNANQIDGVSVTNTPAHEGQLLIVQPGLTTLAYADPLVQGLYAAGQQINAPVFATPTTIQPILIGGSDYSGTPLLQNWKVDSSGLGYVSVANSVTVTGTVAVTQSTSPWVVSGTVAVTQSTSPWVVSLTSTTITGTVTVVGDAASGSPVAGNPVLMGGSDGTDARTLLTSTTGQLHTIVDSSGTLTVAGSKSVNTATPGSTNVGTLPAQANAASPGPWTEGFQVPLSTDLSGNLRVTTTGAGGSVQYAEGTTIATATGTVALGKNASNVVSALKLDGSGNLDSNIQSATFAAANGAAIPANTVWIGASDGTDLQGLRVSDSTNKELRVAIYAGGNEATVTSNRLLVDPSGVTSPVSIAGTVTVSQSQFYSQTSTTSGQIGPLVQGAVITADPTYTTAQTSPLSLTTTGHLRTQDSAETNANGTTVVPTNAMFIGVKGADGFLHPATSSTNDGHIDVNASFSGTINPGFVADRQVSGSIAATSAVVNASTQGASSVTIRVSGTWTGTLTFQLSTEDGTYATATAFPMFTGGVSVTTTTANGAWQIPVGGAASVQIFGTSIGSGSATISIEVGAGSMLVYVVQPTAGNLNTTAVQGTAGTIGQSWFTKVTDGTNVFGTTTTHPFTTQDSSDGAPATTSQPTTAMQVAGWDGTHLRVISTDSSGFVNVNAAISGSFTPALTSDRTQTGTITTTGTQVISTQGTGTVLFNITGSWTGTIQFEASVDGTNWVSAKAVAKYPTATPSVSSTTSNGQWAIPTGGLNSFRLRGATVSGTATVWMEGGAGAQDITVFSVLSDPNDGTNAVIKAASTTPVAADQALVVALSPNSAQFATSTTANTLPGVNPVSVTTSSVAILNTNTARKECTIVNTGTTVIFLGLGQTPTGTAYHIALGGCTLANDGTGGTYTSDMWKGTINAISSLVGGTVCVTELT